MKRKTFNRVARAVTAVHIGLYRATGGRVGGKLGGLPMLLLTTTGRRSGRLRTVPLTYLRDGENLLLAASNAGNPWYPGWWLNLVASPSAQVQMGPHMHPVTARKASADEHRRLWPLFVAAYRGYGAYQAKTTREIPVVILTLRGSDFL